MCHAICLFCAFPTPFATLPLIDGQLRRSYDPQMPDAFVDITESNTARRVRLDDRALWRIGRGQTSEIHVTDKKASREHALIQRLPHGQLVLIDCGSRNGSFLNGKRLTLPTALKHNDIMNIGNTALIFTLTTEQPATTLSAASEFTVTTENDQRICEACILVIDVRNYTVLSQKLDNLAVAELIGAWCERIGQIIADHGSVVDKFIGDAVMAVWFDVPDAREPASLTALRAARAIRQCTQQLAKQTDLPSPLGIGAGINMGPAAVSTLGVRGKQDYTVLGDSVNMAFHIESVTRPLNCDIALSTSAFNALANLQPPLDFKSTQAIIKGHADPVTVHVGGFDTLDTWLQAIGH